MDDTSDANGNADATGENSVEIPPEQDRSASPSEQEISQKHNEDVERYREKFIYGPSRRIIKPVRLFVDFLDAHGGQLPPPQRSRLPR
jgi:hypothetical protein